MKRGIIILFLVILLSSFISAEIIFNEQIKTFYNLGENIFVPVTIKGTKDISGIFQMDLICNNGTPINFYKNGVKLNFGAEKSMDSSLVLIRSIIGENKGACKIKAILNGEEEEYLLSSEFKISDILNIQANLEKTEFDAGEGVLVTGKVSREDGENSDGFVEIKMTGGNIKQEINQAGTINNGEFSMNITLPSDLEAGNYLIEIKAYEKDNLGLITNNGLTSINNLSIKQVPTNLELIFGNKEVDPNSFLKVKAILHDQTGKSINSTVSITIIDSSEKMLEQKEINTDEFFEYPIKYNEPPAKWKISALSNELTAEDYFNIKEKESVDIKIINKTILVTNIGNVFYNKTLLIQIGETPLNVQAELKVGESKKYILSAPDGKYDVRITSRDNKDEEVSETIALTGDAVGIKESSGRFSGIIFWILLILILMSTSLVIFKKIYKKSFFGHMPFISKKKEFCPISVHNNLVGNKAELSLSIKGDKQDASIICVKIKDLKDILSGKGSAADSIKKIIELAEGNKVATYENQDYLFFIFAPIKTKTFKNEKTALDLAEEIKKILIEHNKMFNQKIDFGISLNYGTIVAKLENNIFKFMSMGSLITLAKKISSISKGELLLGEKINDLLRLNIKTEKKIKEGIPVFLIKEIKKEDEETKKFIDRFVKRLGK